MKLIIVVFIALLALGSGIFIYQQKSKAILPSQKACTLEAKICPDGTSVGRTGPNCSFAPCPIQKESSPSATTNWKTYSNSADFSLNYPPSWRQDMGFTGNTDLLTNAAPCEHCGGRKSGIYITINDNKNRLNLDDYLNQVIIPAQQGCGPVKKVTDRSYVFKGVTAIIADGFCGAGAPGPVAFISKNDQVIELFSDGANIDEVYQIFSTFKFNQ